MNSSVSIQDLQRVLTELKDELKSGVSGRDHGTFLRNASHLIQEAQRFLSMAEHSIDGAGRIPGAPVRMPDRDSTERKRAEEALRCANERLELAQSAAGAGVWDWDIATGRIEWSPELFRLFGLDPGKDSSGFDAWRRVVHPDDLQIALDRIDRAILEGSILDSEYRVLLTDGAMRWINARGRTIYDTDRRPLRMLGICIDITRRRQAEEALRRSEDRYRSLVEMSPDALFINLNNRVVFVNPAAVRLFGASSADQIVDKSPFDLTHPDYHPIVRQRIERQLAGETAPLIEEKIVRMDGSIVDVEVAAAPFITEEGTAFQVILRDITERKKAEETLVDRQKQLEELNRTLEQRVEEETRKNREKDFLLIHQSRQAEMGEMLSIIAHQWRQPLNNIGLYAQVLVETCRQGELDADCLEGTVKNILDLLRHMSRTIDDFRNFLKPERKRTPFNVRETIDRTYALISESFRVHGIRVEIEGEGSLVVAGHPNEYAQAVMTILNNARDALVERRVGSPRIGIRIASEGERSVVTISDNAGGIAEELLDRIFEPYFTTRDGDKGTGIGLYMSQAIIEKSMRGRLSVRNTPEGAEFRIEV